MITTVGKLVIIDLGKETAQYFWNGSAMGYIAGVFVYKKTKVTLYTTNKKEIPSAELIANGIRIKEVKNV
jgi:hypothetical protein